MSAPDTPRPESADRDDRPVSEIDQLCNTLVGDIAAASPITATYIGVPGYDDRLDDLSPDGLAARDDLSRDTVTRLRAAVSSGQHDDVARAVALERLQVEIDRYDSGWSHAALNVIASPVQDVRLSFDLLPTDTAEQRDTVQRRMAAVPGALAGYRESLRWAAERGHVSARRQVTKTAEQCRTYAGTSGKPGFFTGLAVQISGLDVRADLAREAAGADQAYAELAAYLMDEIAERAPLEDPVGEERYRLASREFLGATVDLAETYEWGWHEFLALEAELRGVAARIAPGEPPAAAAERLDADQRYHVHGQDALQAWLQQLSDRSIRELGRTHFEITGPLQNLECRIAPPGGGVGAYYTGPSDDFSRPGRMWWAVEAGREEFTTWRESTIVYHEGVPGHHLQVGTSVFARAELNDFQRLMAGTSGHAEGWALYAERLVRELGYLDDDGELLGMLDSQLFRAARVVVDIGMHLQLKIPAGTGFHEGERWTPELGLEFMLSRTLTDPAHVRDEIDRYLGWPGQAPSYKVGERIWLAGRDDARRRHGVDFDLKAFHTRALRLGGMGLEPLEAALGRL